MQKLKSPIVIVNYKNNFKNLEDLKKIIKNIEKSVKSLRKNEEQKKVPFEFLLSIPSMFVFPISLFLKEKKNKNLQKIIIGTNNSLDYKKDKNYFFFDQVSSLGSKFVVLEDLDSEALSKLLEDKKNKEVKNTKEETDSILFNRFNTVSRKVEDKTKSTNEKTNNPKDNLLEKKIQILEDNIKKSLDSGVITIFKIKENKFTEDFKNISKIIKGTLKNLHYNLFDRLIICYEPEKSFLETDLSDIEDCEEKAIAIRRTIANMFGIDNAKKVRIVYGGRINQSNTREIIKNGGVDGIYLEEENFSGEEFAEIFMRLKTKK